MEKFTYPMEAHEGQMAPKSKSGLDFVSMGMLIIGIPLSSSCHFTAHYV